MKIPMLRTVCWSLRALANCNLYSSDTQLILNITEKIIDIKDKICLIDTLSCIETISRDVDIDNHIYDNNLHPKILHILDLASKHFFVKFLVESRLTEFEFSITNILYSWFNRK